MIAITKKLLPITIMIALCGCSSSPELELAGTWKGTDHFGQTMQFTMEEDGDLVLRVEGEGQSFSRSGTFKADFSSQPAQFNIKLQDRDEITTILQRIDETHIAFENINSGDERPTEFGEHRIVLERQ